MKKLWLFILVLLILPSIFAVELEVKKLSSNEVMIIGLENPTVFDLQIKNLGAMDDFQFYNLLGFSMAPKGTVSIGTLETKEVQLMLYPQDDFTYRGFYSLEYHIRGADSTEQVEKLIFEVIDLKDAFEVGAENVTPDSKTINVYIKNKKNYNFNSINAEFSSQFFDFQENFSLTPYETKEFTINLDKEKFKDLTAGFYTLNTILTTQSKTAEVDGVINFVEKNIVESTKKDYGFIVTTTTIEKNNVGNTITTSETTITKNIISRLFTSLSPQPDIVERKGFTIYYTWNREIKPGETLDIQIKTNWLFPLLIIILIVAIIILVKRYSATNLTLRKKVSFVNARGGEFALKVSLIVSAAKHIEKVSIVDRLPALVKIHERFGGTLPTRIDEKTRRIEWNFEKLEEGETRILSYIIYSKIGVLGKFALPRATALYERLGKIEETQSNLAFFVAEQRKKDLEEE